MFGQLIKQRNFTLDLHGEADMPLCRLLSRKMITVYYENHTETLCGQNALLMNVTERDTYSHHSDLED